jgi:hypothetical protein
VYPRGAGSSAKRYSQGSERKDATVDDTTQGTLSDEDIRTILPGEGATKVQLQDDTDDTDGTDGDDSDGTDAEDGSDADGTDGKDADGTDGDTTDGTDGDSSATQ